MVKRVPNMIAQLMEGISSLNEVGVAYNNIKARHVVLLTDTLRNVNGLKLINFDYSIVYKDFGESMARSRFYQNINELYAIRQAFLVDVGQTSALITNLFYNYDSVLTTEFKFTDPAMSAQLKLYHAQRKSLWNISKLMRKDDANRIMLHYILSNDYNVIKIPIKE
ncbi:hypothetical protein BDF22DRAFT_741679 [Syncephalis plumigaleata]|nr:hypothetical protein BDF22DRAFT_741679 [Syncephalis plumigaleata]